MNHKALGAEVERLMNHKALGAEVGRFPRGRVVELPWSTGYSAGDA